MPDLLSVKIMILAGLNRYVLISEYFCSRGNNKVPGDVLANQQKEIHVEDRIR